MRTVRIVLLISLLVVPPLLWAGSYFAWLNIDHFGGAHVFDVHVGNGGVYFIVVDRTDPPSWSVAYGSAENDYYPAALRERWRAKTLHYFDRYSFAGFGAKSFALDSAWATNCGLLRIPFWYVTVVGVLLAFWIVRRGERKRAAFPAQENQVK